MSRWVYIISSISTCVTLSLLASGCSSGTNSTSFTTPTIPTPAAATTIFVERSQTTTSSDQAPTYLAAILEFPAASTGAAIPAVNSPQTSAAVNGLALDTSGNLFVGRSTVTPASSILTSSVEVYASPFTASSTPRSTLSLPTGDYADRLYVDTSGQLYVLSNYTGSIYVYASGASGSATPLRVITGSSTQLIAGQTRGLSVDASGNIYVGRYTSSQVLIFSASANGDVAPSRTITVSGGNVSGVATDSAGDTYIALRTDQTNPDGTTTGTASVEEFAPGASGSPSPTHTIAGSATTLERVDGMRVDAAGNLWLVNVTGDNFVPVSSAEKARPHPDAEIPYASSVLEFAAGSTGNVAPQASFASAAWGYGGPEIAIE